MYIGAGRKICSLLLITINLHYPALPFVTSDQMLFHLSLHCTVHSSHATHVCVFM